jgi:NADH-quinone oxidoreductase subunit M
MVLNMNSIPVLFLVFFGGGLLTYIFQKVKKLDSLIALLASALGGYIAFALPGNANSFSFNIASFSLKFGVNDYSQLFAMLVAVLGFFGILYSWDFMSGKESTGYYYMNFLFALGAMFGIVYSRDLLSLFFFWEIMTWSSFLLVIYSGENKHKIGIKYFIYSAIGAYSLLIAIITIYANLGTFDLNQVINGFGGLSLGIQILTTTLLVVGFGVKSAMMPLHVWAPDAYKVTPSSFTAIFSGALSKMGIFGIGLVLFKFVANSEFALYFREILAWIGGLTALFSTFYAVFQHDAKKLLAYSSIGQLGYIIVGLAVGTPLAVTAALFLMILHGVFKAMLFMSVGAVYMRTGTIDMNEVSGLIRNMPFSFLTMLFGIISVAGVPPLGGFVSKWLLYEALIQSNHYFLVIIIFFASTAAFLYLYRLIFSLFLGQREKDFENVKEAPASMIIPMLIMAAFVLVVGVFPGIILKPISAAMISMGLTPAQWENSVLFSAWGEQVNLLAVVNSIGIIFILGAIFITWKNYKQTRWVSTKDIHTAGEVPTENENLTFAVNFYQPFERALGDVLKPSVDKLFNLIGINLEELFDYLRYVYTGNGQTYAMYVILFMVILILFSGSIFGIPF